MYKDNLTYTPEQEQRFAEDVDLLMQNALARRNGPPTEQGAPEKAPQLHTAEDVIRELQSSYSQDYGIASKDVTGVEFEKAVCDTSRGCIYAVVHVTSDNTSPYHETENGRKATFNLSVEEMDKVAKSGAKFSSAFSNYAKDLRDNPLTPVMDKIQRGLQAAQEAAHLKSQTVIGKGVRVNGKLTISKKGP